jgi:hypothetical protein
MKIYILKKSFEFGQLSIWDVTYILTLPFTLERSNGVTRVVNVRGWILMLRGAR